MAIGFTIGALGVKAIPLGGEFFSALTIRLTLCCEFGAGGLGLLGLLSQFLALGLECLLFISKGLGLGGKCFCLLIEFLLTIVDGAGLFVEFATADFDLVLLFDKILALIFE